MGNSDLRTRNKISYGSVMCFVFVFIMIKNNIYSDYIPDLGIMLVYGALTRLPSQTLAMPLGATKHSLNTSV